MWVEEEINYAQVVQKTDFFSHLGNDLFALFFKKISSLCYRVTESSDIHKQNSKAYLSEAYLLILAMVVLLRDGLPFFQ